MAVAGGTGTGKSSLVNALAGEVITSVSVLRPHTDEPFAVVPVNPEPAVTVLLDTLGIAYRREHAAFTRTAIIDLPDIDSIADWHRERVEDLIPRVDGVIWLFDPDKYRDPIVHDEFLSQLAVHKSQFIFALNKIDKSAPRRPADGASGPDRDAGGGRVSATSALCPGRRSTGCLAAWHRLVP